MIFTGIYNENNHEFDYKGAIKAVCFAPNGSHLASGSADECIRVTDVTSSEVMSNYINVHTGIILQLVKPKVLFLFTKKGQSAQCSGAETEKI